VTVDEVDRRLSWTSGRAIDALDTLLDVSFAIKGLAILPYLTFSLHICIVGSLRLRNSCWFLQEGLAMIDDGHRDGKRRYWFPCVSSISTSVADT
jgi:ESCRT-II complex subunit VPS22